MSPVNGAGFSFSKTKRALKFCLWELPVNCSLSKPRELFLKELSQGAAEIFALPLKVIKVQSKGWLGSGMNVMRVAF